MKEDLLEKITRDNLRLLLAGYMEKNELTTKKISKAIDVNSFIENLKTCYKLYANEIYSEEEFLKKKKSLIDVLYSKKITCSIEDFLLEIVTLKKLKILNTDDINKIKNLVM